MTTTITSSVGTTTVTTYAWTGTVGLSASTRREGIKVTRNESANPYAATSRWPPNNTASSPATRDTVPSSPPGTSITTGTVGQWISGAALLSVYDIDGLGTATTVPTRATAVWVYVNASGYSARVGTMGQQTSLTANAWTLVRTTVPQSGSSAGSLVVTKDSGTPSTTDRAWATGSITYFGDAAPSAYFDGNTPGSSVTVRDTSTPLLMLGFETARSGQNIYHEILGGGQDVTLQPAPLRSGTLRFLYPDEASAVSAEVMFAKAAVFSVEDTDRAAVSMRFALDGTLNLNLDESRELWLVDVGYREVNL
jgi:hypothetical protein